VTPQRRQRLSGILPSIHDAPTLSAPGCLRQLQPEHALGPVDIHRSQIVAPTKNSIAANEIAVFS
jgi:hypothetical protein